MKRFIEGADRTQINRLPDCIDDYVGTECVNSGVTPLGSKSMTSNNRAEGRFDKQNFIYVASDDEYRYPPGQRAIRRFTTVEAGLH